MAFSRTLTSQAARYVFEVNPISSHFMRVWFFPFTCMFWFSLCLSLFQDCRFRFSENERLFGTVNEILEALPHEFDLNIVADKYPTTNADSVNLVLQQEVCKYNQLLKCIRTDAVQVLDAIQGIYLRFFPSSPSSSILTLVLGVGVECSL